jgi:hypothetical protein
MAKYNNGAQAGWVDAPEIAPDSYGEFDDYTTKLENQKMLYSTSYGQNIHRILGRYGMNHEAAVVALETLFQTALARAKQADLEAVAKSTCRGLHMDKPGRGVVCSKCFEAAFERGVTDRAISGDRLGAGRQAPPTGIAETPAAGSGATPTAAPAAVDRAAIAAEVLRMLGEPGEKR